ncbi:MAG: cytochrome c3 family protein [Bradymonadia bacterium]
MIKTLRRSSTPGACFWALLALVSLLGAEALALPQWAVQSGRACDTCHTDPTGWPNPELAERKCSLSCGTCHVNPTGGGMRNAGGLYFGRQTLPMFGSRPADELYKAPKIKLTNGPSPGSQPSQAPTEEMKGTPIPKGDWYWQMPLDQAPRLGVWPWKVPGPMTAGRYAGIPVSPTFQVGTDLRFMAYYPQEEGVETAYFPMQADLHLLARPYNPEGVNVGRLTTLITMGFQGSRGEEFDGFVDRYFTREWWALYDNLPYQFYVKGGRFLPAYGWKLDDHTAYTRQGMDLLGTPFDHERQVTGVEVGLNPNYFYAHASLFNAAQKWDEPIKDEDGYGAALTAGWRHMGWHVGGSLMGGSKEGLDQVTAGANWALNLMWYDILPIMYLGELNYTHSGLDGRDRNGMNAFHEVEVRATRGVQLKLRYDWRDPDTQFIDDHLHRYIVGVQWYPVSFLEVIVQYRHNRELEQIDNDEFFVQLHGWY